MKLDGVGYFKLIKADGTVKEFSQHNLIVNSGFEAMCGMLGNGDSHMSAIGVGTGTTETTADMTALENELTKLDAEYAHVAGTKVFTMKAMFDEGVATGAITEAGVFSADGVMIDRVTFNVINKDVDDKFEATFQFTLS